MNSSVFKYLSPLLLATAVAHATVLMYDGFPIGTGYYTAGKNVTAPTCPGTDKVFGFMISDSGASKWLDGTGVFIAHAAGKGLDFPAVFPPEQFSAVDSSAGICRSEKNKDHRAQYKVLATNLFPGRSGTLYFRFLMNMDQTSMDAMTGESDLTIHNYIGAGLVDKTGNTLLTASTRVLFFFYNKHANGAFTLNLGLRGTGDSALRIYPLVANPVAGETYLCFAEISFGTGTGGTEQIRAFAVPCSTFVLGGLPYNTDIGDHGVLEADLADASSGPTHLAMAGAYGTGSGYVRFDEFGLATESDDLVPSSAAAPVLTNLSLTKTGVADFTLSAGLSQGTANLVATLDNGVDTPTVVPLASGLTPSSGTVSTTLPIASLTAGTTYQVSVSATNSDGADIQYPGNIYLGTPTAQLVRDAEEYNYVPGQIRVSRASADTYPLTVYYTVTPDAIATPGTTYKAPSGVAVIPAGEASTLIEIVPMFDQTVTEDVSISLSLASSLYYTGTPAVGMNIANAVPPDGYNTFISRSGNKLGGRASEPENWSLGRVPVETDHILVDGFFSNTELRWDASDPTLPDTVASWTQTTNYANTATILTTYPDVENAFPVFHIAGDCILEGGRFSQGSNTTAEHYRLSLDIGGDLRIGPSFILSCYDCGFTAGNTHPGTALASHASSPSGYAGVYDNVYRPYHIGNGSATGKGGGAAWIEVAGDAVNNGTIAVRCSGGGAAGSFYLKAKSFSGSGSLSVAGGTSAGRVGIELTEAETMAYPHTSVNISGASGGGGGTLVVKGASQTYGTLYVDNYRSHSDTVRWPTPTQITAIPAGETWTFDALVFRQQGMLAVPEGTTLVLPNGIGSISGTIYTTDIRGGLFLAGGTLDIGAGPYVLSGGTDEGDGTQGWIFQADTPYTFNGDVTLRNGAAIGCLTFGGDSTNLADRANYAVCDVTIRGDLTVDSGAYLWAKGGGPDMVVDGDAITGHGGQSGACGALNYAYDSVFDPVLPGYGNKYNASAAASNAGGGVLLLTVEGDLVLNGDATAEPGTYTDCCGSGGTLNIRAATLSGSGKISASTLKPSQNAARSSGGGGRIAIRLTEGDIGTGGIWNRITAQGYSCYTNGTPFVQKDNSSSAGTIYLQGASDGEGRGLLRISNDNYADNDKAITALPSGRWTTDRLSAYRRVRLAIDRYAKVKLFADLTFGATTIDAGSAFDIAGHTATFDALAVAGGDPVPEGIYRVDDPLLDGLFLDTSAGGTGKVVVQRLAEGTILLLL